MGQINKISSFKSFSEVKSQEATMKLREENNVKRQDTVCKIGEILDEMGLTSLTELDEDKRNALISRMFGVVSEDDAKEIEDEINKLGEPKKIKAKSLSEGNAFLGARSKAIEEEKDEFEFNGKTFKVTYKADIVAEGNAFGAARAKAIADGKKEFEVEGKTYKVEDVSKDDKENAKEAGDKEFEFNGKTFQVTESLLEGEVLVFDKLGSPLGELRQEIYNIIQATDDDKWIKALQSIENDLYKLERSIGKYDSKLGVIPTNEGEVTEGNAFGAARAKAIADGKKEFEVEGKTYKVEDVSKDDKENAKEFVAEGESGVKSATILSNQILDFLEANKVIKPNDAQKIHKHLINFLEKTVSEGNTVTFALDDGDLDGKTFKVEGTIYEGKGFKNTKDFEKFLEEIDAMGESSIRKIMGKEYIDTPGNYKEEVEDYDGVEDYMQSNMGTEEFNSLADWWITNVKESVVNEAGAKGDIKVGDIVGNTVQGFYFKVLEIKKDKLVVLNMDTNKKIETYIDNMYKPSKAFVAEGRGTSSLEKYVKSKYKDQRVNQVTFEELLEPIAIHIDAYTGANMGDLEYESNVIYDFKELTDSMAQAHIDGSDLDESKVNEAKEYSFIFNYNTDEDDIQYIQKVLDRAGADAVAKAGIDSEEMVIRAFNAKGLKDARKAIEADGFEIQESKVTEGIKFKKGSKVKTRDGNIETVIRVNSNGNVETEESDYSWPPTSLTKESKVNEAEIKSDDEFKEYAFTILKKAFTSDFDEAKAQEVVDGILKKTDGDYGAAVGMITSSLS